MMMRSKSRLSGGKQWYNHLVQKDTDIQIHISSSPEDKDWDDYLAQTSGGSHIQTTKWAQVKAQLGWRAWRVFATDNRKIIGGAQMLLRPLALGLSIGYVPRGPVMMNFQPKLAQQIVNTLKKVAGHEKCLMLSIQPPQNGQSFSALLQKNQFTPSSLEVAPTATVLIDLTPEPDEILARMKRGTRYNIGLSSRKDITIDEGDQQALKEFYKLLRMTSKRQNFKIFPMEYFKGMWDSFDMDGNIKLFLAKYNTQVVSAQLAIAFGDTVVNKWTVWSGQHAKLRPNEGLIWGVMQWAKAQGYRYYDLEGIEREAAERILRDEDLPKSMKATVSHFKLGFGGDVVLFPPSYTFVPNPFAKWVYRNLIDRGTIPPAVQSVLDHIRTTDNQ
jgi:lipid II:glycine glycyltransferase (peptidoglycan interpeptide bridge formation enzyme)